MQVIVCGCSWANGAELAQDEKAFGYLVAQHLQARCIHRAQDAASIPHMILQLRSAIQDLDPSMPAIALFLLTGRDRDLVWSRTRPIGTGHMYANPPPYKKAEPIFLNASDPLHLDWYTEFHSAELAEFRTNTSIITLQALCDFHGIKDYYAWAFDCVPLWSEIPTQRFWRQARQSMRDPEFEQARINTRIKHPDQAQHQLMAKRFLDLIQNS